MLILRPNQRGQNETFLFLKRLLKNPRGLGAILPSSRALAKFICKHVHYEEGDFIVEIGAGTGRFTHALIESGVPHSKLVVLELDPELAAYLKQKFPEVLIIQADARMLETVIPQEARGKVRTIVSGIPMVNLPRGVQRGIISSCFNILGDRGQVLQFTYGPLSPISSRVFGLKSHRLGHVFQNIPPATLWKYSLKPVHQRPRKKLLRRQKLYMKRFFSRNLHFLTHARRSR